METMTRTEAAKYLGVSPRSINNYVKRGELSVKYINGKYGQEAQFKQSDLDAFRKAKEIPTFKPSNPDNLPIPRGKINNQSLALASPRNRPLLITEIAAKPLLKLDEVALLTGLSKNFLRNQIQEGKLRAAKVSGAWRLKATDIDQFIAKLF